MKFSTALARTLLSLFIAVAVADEDIGLCCLCDGCFPAVQGRGDLAVNDAGYTCTELILDMADTDNHILQGNKACTQLQFYHHNRCCNAAHDPADIVQAPTNSPGDAYPSGPNGWCDLCFNGNYPSKPTTIVAVLDYPLVSTCRDLYWRGQKGYFTDSWCAPLRNFYVEPCGCNVPDDSSGGTGNDGDFAAPYQGGSGGFPDDIPIKKEPQEGSKKQMKMFNEFNDEERGSLKRERRLKGSNGR
jgi:hypothetical protein